MKKLIEAVKKMREAQKNYFRTREQRYLIDSKYLESVVDKILAEGGESLCN